MYSRLPLVFTTRYGPIAYIQQIELCLKRGTDRLLIYSRLRLVFTARNELIACTQQIAFVFTARYVFIAYSEWIAFSVYSGVRPDCLYTADYV